MIAAPREHVWDRIRSERVAPSALLRLDMERIVMDVYFQGGQNIDTEERTAFYFFCGVVVRSDVS